MIIYVIVCTTGTVDMLPVCHRYQFNQDSTCHISILWWLPKMQLKLERLIMIRIPNQTSLYSIFQFQQISSLYHHIIVYIDTFIMYMPISAPMQASTLVLRLAVISAYFILNLVVVTFVRSWVPMLMYSSLGKWAFRNDTSVVILLLTDFKIWYTNEVVVAMAYLVSRWVKLTQCCCILNLVFEYCKIMMELMETIHCI